MLSTVMCVCVLSCNIVVGYVESVSYLLLMSAGSALSGAALAGVYAGAVRVRLIRAVVCVAVLLHCLCVTVSSVVRQSSCNDRDV
jgi:hypothetical protein